MSTQDLDFGNLDELAGLLTAAGVRSASTNPAEITTPGVWIRFDGVSLDRLAGCTIKLTLHLIVGDAEPRIVMPELAALFNQVRPVLNDLGGPAGDTTRVGVVLPNSTKPLPALAVPLDLITTT